MTFFERSIDLMSRLLRLYRNVAITVFLGTGALFPQSYSSDSTVVYGLLVLNRVGSPNVSACTKTDSTGRITEFRIPSDLFYTVKFDSSILKLTKMKRLTIDGNYGAVLPDYLGDLESLEYLSASQCGLRALPLSLDDNLAYLDVGNNSIPAAHFSLHRWTKLTVCKISGNYLDSLPLTLLQSPGIKTLLVTGSYLPVLPPELGGVATLDTLDLTNNRIVAFPQGIELSGFGSSVKSVRVRTNGICHPSAGITAWLARFDPGWDTTQRCSPPKLTLSSTDTLYTVVNRPLSVTGASASDNLDGNLTNSIKIGAGINYGLPGLYQVKYMVTNRNGYSDSAFRTLIVLARDTLAPVLTVDTAEVTMEQGRTVKPVNVSALDKVYGNLTKWIVVTGAVDSMTPGVYVRTYSVTDSSGNTAAKSKRYIVVKDTTPPVLTLLGDTLMGIMINAAFSDPGFVATDGSLVLTGSVQRSGTYDTSQAGTYQLTYTVKDPVGNTTEKRRLLQVGENPVLSQFRINQIGYYPRRSKRAVITGSAVGDSFQIVDAVSGSVAAAFSLKKINTGGVAAVADFSPFTTSGTFYLQVKGFGRSRSFQIKEGLYTGLLAAALKAYYYQRCSFAIAEPWGGLWRRAAGHADTVCRLADTGAPVRYCSAPGGWYDAGDYGKYMVTAGITVTTLLNLYELYPTLVPDGFSKISESGNGVSDLLDEARYELEWMIRMQDNDGGVYFKVTTAAFPPFIEPCKDTAQRFVYQKSTSATLHAAATLALAGRLYKSVDSPFASNCLNRAEAAWLWAKNNPSAGVPAGGTGSYPDAGNGDEFAWAATQLFISTNRDEYKTFAESNLSFDYGPLSWQKMMNFGIYAIIANKSKASAALLGAVTPITYFCKKVLDIYIDFDKQNPYRVNTSLFYWGANSNVLNEGMNYYYGYLHEKNEKYLDEVVHDLDYMLGLNHLGKSYVTGFGYNPPENPHHRISASDGVPAPVSGWLVGGPNGGEEDARDPQSPVVYPYSGTGMTYVDQQNSYASNEVAINWNAPLVFLVGALESFSPQTAIHDAGAVNTAAVNRTAVDFFRQTRKMVTIGIDLAGPGRITVSIFNLQGRFARCAREVSGVRGLNRIDLPLYNPKLPAGYYVLQVTAPGCCWRKKIAVFR